MYYIKHNLQPHNHLINFENMKQDIFDTEISIYNGVRDVYGNKIKESVKAKSG